MVVRRDEFEALVARAFDGAIVVDGVRVVAHRGGMHVVRGGRPPVAPVTPREPQPLDRDNNWSDV
jgi:hypothetical protein